MQTIKTDLENCLPKLDTTLISLIGISSAAYVALKINENKSIN